MIVMVICPNCKKENPTPNKTWQWGQFTVKAYVCGNCGTSFRDYSKLGKHAFTLQHKKGRYLKQP
jgi:DNA-directed RNA polymerase subunit RPC12/RpoP